MGAASTHIHNKKCAEGSESPPPHGVFGKGINGQLQLEIVAVESLEFLSGIVYCLLKDEITFCVNISITFCVKSLYAFCIYKFIILCISSIPFRVTSVSISTIFCK